MLNKLQQVISVEKIKTDVSMSALTTFRTGGNADVVLYPTELKELKNILELFYETKTEYYIMGNGSNLLVSDNGVKKPVIYLGKNYSSVDVFEDCITAKAGASLSSIAKIACENSLSGFEFAAGIPGTLGGAVIMNAGAYGGEMKDVIEAVSFLSCDGTEYVVSGEEMEFGYRHSALSDTGCVVTGAVIKLNSGKKEDILAKMSELAAKRREKQPLEFPSAGSTFKRPTGNFAGTLIEKAGLKGTRIGGAEVSEKHAGFIINKDKATTTDILSLIELVRETVYKENGIMLETEVKYWD